MKIIKIILLFIIILLIIGMFLLPEFISPPLILVSVLPFNMTFAPGDNFELAVLIDPMGTYIAGAKLNLSFNADVLRINEITEGNLFKQNGSNTFFNSGIVNNSDGIVINIFDAILGNTNVSSPGTFILINLTVINSSGSSGINISNVEIVDPNGRFVAANVTNGSLIVHTTATLILQPISYINGTVIDHSLKTGIHGVTVSMNTGNFIMTNESGFYSFEIIGGTYDLEAKLDPVYYVNNTITVSTIENEFLLQDIELTKKPTGTITGNVTKIW